MNGTKLARTLAQRARQQRRHLMRQHRSTDDSTRVVLFGIALVAGYLLVKQLPDVRRYLKISRM